MTMRKPNKAQEMSALRNEIATVEAFMAPAIREIESLDAARKERHWTNAEMKRADELIDYIHEKNVWLAKARDTLRGYHAFAMA